MVILVEGGELMQFLWNLDPAIVTENEIVCVDDEYNKCENSVFIFRFSFPSLPLSIYVIVS